jgi:hypothetical protein
MSPCLANVDRNNHCDQHPMKKTALLNPGGLHKELVWPDGLELMQGNIAVRMKGVPSSDLNRKKTTRSRLTLAQNVADQPVVVPR